MKYEAFLGKQQKKEPSLETYGRTEGRDADAQHAATALLRPDTQFPACWATALSPSEKWCDVSALCRADAFWSSCLQTAHGGAARRYVC